jgi:hypothetical protein
MTTEERKLLDLISNKYHSGKLKWKKRGHTFTSRLNEKISIHLIAEKHYLASLDVYLDKQLIACFGESSTVKELMIITEMKDFLLEKFNCKPQQQQTIKDAIEILEDKSQKREKNIKQILQPESILEKVKRLFIR